MQTNPTWVFLHVSLWRGSSYSDHCYLISPSTLQHSLNVPVNHVAVPQACYRFMPSVCAWGCAAFVRLCECVSVCCLRLWWWQPHRIARKKEQPLVRVNNAVMVAHTRLMITDWGWGGEAGDEFNYLEDTHISSLSLSFSLSLSLSLSHTHTQTPWQGYIALSGAQ